MEPIVLIGGGPQHYRLLQSLTDEKRAGRSIILVNKHHKVLPTQHIPLLLSPKTSESQLTFDLWSACQRKSVYFLEDECLHIDRVSRRIQLKNFGKLPFSSLSLETGIEPSSESPSFGFDISRPLELRDKMQRFFEEVKRHCPREVRVVIEGWRRESVELAAVIKNEIRSSCEVCDIVLVTTKNFSEMGMFSSEKNQIKNLKKMGIRCLEGAQVAEFRNHQLRFSDDTSMDCDIFLSFNSHQPSLLEKVIGQKRGLWSVGRDLSDIKDSDIFICGNQVHFEREERWVHEISGSELNKVLLHNIFVRDKNEPTISCRDLLAINESTLGPSSGGLFSKPEVAEKKIKNWQNSEMTEIESLRIITVGDESKTQMSESLGYQAAHMSRPWRGLVSSASRNQNQNYQLVSFNGFNCWGNYGQSAIKICEMALLKCLSRGVLPRHLRFNLTLPSGDTHLTQHIFESSFKAVEMVCDQHDVDIDGGDTFDGKEWHLTVTVGGEVFQEEQGAIRPHDYLIMTRPLGYGLLWAGRMENPFDSSWIDSAINSQILPSVQEYLEFVENFQPSHQILIEEWGFIFHCLDRLPGDQQMMVNFREIPRWQGIDSLIPKKVDHPGLATNWQRIHKDLAFEREEVSHTNSILWDSLSQGALVFSVSPDRWEGALKSLRDMGYSQASLVGCTRPKSKGSRVILSDWSPS